ncbi:AfsR/SARP family transcriptional regulator [Actinomadura chokoriensis]|uniref:AfsR/SARP family transcriptional regulator n=1 Tax=Actinomadura chokoriensis TaxID=454156 RepID=UPI0031F78F3F
MEEVALLGPVEMRVSGRRLDLGTPKESCVLAVLSVECGHVVPPDVLADRIWGPAPPARARATLTSYVSRLRRRLRGAGVLQPPLRHRPGGYVLTLDPEAIDLHRFRRLRRQARAIADSGDDEHARILLREAETLWRGQPLTGLQGDWVRRLRESLREELHAARLERIEVELRLGLQADVLGDLFRLTDANPFDEGAAALLMTALYRCDRQAEALAVYQRMHRLLSDEAGTEPGERLRRLHERILRRDLGLAATPGYVAETVPADLLPPGVDDFVGRDREIEMLTRPGRAADGRAPVSVITGLAGVGKSALALRVARELAHRHPDAQIYLDMRGHDPERPALAPHAALADLLRLLGIAPARIPSGLDERAVLWRQEMSRRRAVVVLDDVIGIEQVRTIVSARSTRFLITSRRRLTGLTGAAYLPLDVLDVEEARALARGIAGERLADGHIDDIVRRSGRLPLALRVAAGRAAVCTTGHEDDLGSPADSDQDDDLAQAAFEFSYRALPDEPRRILRRLGLSPCSETGIEDVPVLSGCTDAASRDAVDTLLDHHLVEEFRPGRLRMHDLVRAFARSRAFTEDSSGDRRRAIGRLLNRYLTCADGADRVLHPHRRRLPLPGGPPDVTARPSTSTEARTWMKREWRNGLALAHHAIVHEWKRQGILLVHLLSRYLETHELHESAAEAQREALHAARELRDIACTARMLFELSLTNARIGRFAAALEFAQEALALYRGADDQPAVAEVLDRTGIYLWGTGRYREALAHYQEAQVIYRRAGDQHGEAEVLDHAGIVLWHLGRYEEAVLHLRGSMEAYRSSGDERGEAGALNNLGEVQRQRGYHRDALRHYLEASQVFGRFEEHRNSAILQNNIGNVHQYKGNYAEALRCYRETIAVFRAAGDRRSVADTLNSLGVTYLLMDRPAEALVHHENAERMAQEIEDPYQRVRAVQGIADAHLGTGRAAAALDHYREALSVARGISDPYHEGKAHEGIAAALLQLRGPDAARIHWRQALDLFERLGVPEARAIAIRLQTMDGVSA